MSDEPFTLDTNILIYSVDLKAGDRHELAKQIICRSALSPHFSQDKDTPSGKCQNP
jgi:hypothetical protein